MAKFRWGIFGTGAISAKFVAGLAAARDAETVFVASRSLKSTEIWSREEILASQKKMLERQREKGYPGNHENVDYEKMGCLYRKHLMDMELWLKKQQNMDVLFVNYYDLLIQPRAQVQAISSFLGHQLNINEMVKVVDKSLYRNRAVSPTSFK